MWTPAATKEGQGALKRQKDGKGKHEKAHTVPEKEQSTARDRWDSASFDVELTTTSKKCTPKPFGSFSASAAGHFQSDSFCSNWSVLSCRHLD